MTPRESITRRAFGGRRWVKLPLVLELRERRIVRVGVRRQKATGWLWECRCARCGHDWTSWRPAPPARCPSCKAHGFDRPARPYHRKKD